MNAHEWKVGDEATIVEGWSRDYPQRIVHVVRVTKTQVVTSDGNRWMSSGWSFGNRADSTACIRPTTDAHREAVARKDAREAIERVLPAALSHLPVADLERVLAILEGREPPALAARGENDHA